MNAKNVVGLENPETSSVDGPTKDSPREMETTNDATKTLNDDNTDNHDDNDDKSVDNDYFLSNVLSLPRKGKNSNSTTTFPS